MTAAVGAAIAMLYSLFRQQLGGSRKPMLAFPSGAARGSQIRNPGVLFNGLAAPQFSAIDYAEWARSQVRLGWIIRAVLERTEWFADQGAMPCSLSRLRGKSIYAWLRLALLWCGAGV